MKAKFFDNDVVQPKLLLWQQAHAQGNAALEQRALIEICQNIRGLITYLVGKIEFFGDDTLDGFERTDFESLLLEKAIKSLPSFRPENGSAYTFFYVALQRCLYSQLSYGKRRRNTSYHEPNDKTPWVEKDKYTANVEGHGHTNSLEGVERKHRTRQSDPEFWPVYEEAGKPELESPDWAQDEVID
jgi:hypothetical protein